MARATRGIARNQMDREQTYAVAYSVERHRWEVVGLVAGTQLVPWTPDDVRREAVAAGRIGGGPDACGVAGRRPNPHALGSAETATDTVSGR